MKKFNTRAFFISFVLTGCLLILSFFAAWAKDEGTLGNGFISSVLAKLFYTLRFPTHTLLWDFFSSNATIYFLGLLINIIFWGFVFERTVFLLRILKRHMQS